MRKQLPPSQRPERLAGPHALQAWVQRHYRLFQAGCRKAVLRGHNASDLVVWAMPTAESLDDPPVAFEIADRRNPPAWTAANALVQKMARTLADESPMPGGFYVAASRAEGRFKGTMTCMLRIPDADELLPESPFLVGQHEDN